MDNQNGKQIEHTDSNNHLNTDNNHSVKEDCERHSPKMAKMAETNNPNAIVMDKKNKSVHSTKHSK